MLDTRTFGAKEKRPTAPDPPRKAARKGLSPNRRTYRATHRMGPISKTLQLNEQEDCEDDVMKCDVGNEDDNDPQVTSSADTIVVHTQPIPIEVLTAQEARMKENEPAGCQIGENCIQGFTPEYQGGEKDTAECGEEVAHKPCSHQPHGSCSFNHLLNPCTRTEIGSGDLYQAWQPQELQSHEVAQMANSSSLNDHLASRPGPESAQNIDGGEECFVEAKENSKPPLPRSGILFEFTVFAYNTI